MYSGSSFAKETRDLKMRSPVTGHQKLTSASWEQSSKLASLQLHKKLPENSTLTILWTFGIWKKGEKICKWVSHELTENKNIIVLMCCLLLFYGTTTNHCLINLWRGTKKWILYNNQQQPAQWLNWEEAPKYFLNPNLQQKEVMITVWWSAAHLIHYSFLNSSKTIISEKHAQLIDEIHWKLQSLQPALVNRMGPIFLHDTVWPQVAQPILQKLNESVMKFCPICRIHLTTCQLTTTSSSILTTFFLFFF